MASAPADSRALPDLGPIAFIQESTTALVQMATREAGTDWVLINQAGLASGVIVGLAILGLVAGLGWRRDTKPESDHLRTLLSGLLAVVCPVVARLRPGEVMEVPIGAVWTAVSLGIAVIALFLVI